MDYETITEIVAFTDLVSTAALWLFTAIQFNRIRLRFLKDCPEEARKYVTTPGYKSPKNVTFLYKEEALAVLRLHPNLWAMRHRAVILMIVSIIWPISCMVSLGIVLSCIG
jgi:hypothetical protein